MADTSVTFAYDALLSTTLVKYQSTLRDNITTSNKVLFFIMRSGMYKRVSFIGERMGVPLMYSLTPADVYAGWDPMNRTPMNGITTAFYQWRDYAASIMINRDEMLKNKGEAQILSLLEAKITQSEEGLKEIVAKSILQGNGPNTATAVTTAFTSNVNGNVGVDPLPLLVKKDPSTTTVGAIDPATETWWRNQTEDIDAPTTFAGQLHSLRTLHAECQKGPLGAPDFHIADMNTYLWYEKALAAAHQNPSYTQADIPFDNIKFKGAPVMWDEFAINVEDESTTLDTDEGSWYMLNSKSLELQVEESSDFATTPFKESLDQQGRAADVLWGPVALGVNNRRKNGVAYSINTTVVS